MPLIDSHTHLDFPDYDNDLDLVLSRAKQYGVDKIINVGADLVRSKKAIEIANKYGNVWATVGIHPEGCDIDISQAQKELKKLATSSPKVVAIGECGLDYFYDDSKKVKQKALFELQINIAQELNFPLAIHLRNGKDETAAMDGYNLLKKNKVTNGVVHCFTFDKTWAKKFINLGLYVGFTGIITYKNAELLREAVKSVPIDRMLIETDCPYLSPQKYRGERNEPSYVSEIAKQIAETREEKIEKVTEQTAKNTEILFNI
ncbi:MAG: TatD family hydrolase [Patescibacteria group bacterium]|jgi:TatD DNase family protein